MGLSVSAVETLIFRARRSLAQQLTDTEESGRSRAVHGLLLGPLAAAVKILGGEGAIWRAVLGAFFLQMISNGFNLLNVQPVYQQVFKGSILLAERKDDRLHADPARGLDAGLDAEAEQIVARQSYPESPPRVEYTLTEKGRALLPVVQEMRRFGHEWLGCGVHHT